MSTHERRERGRGREIGKGRYIRERVRENIDIETERQVHGVRKRNIEGEKERRGIQRKAIEREDKAIESVYKTE